MRKARKLSTIELMLLGLANENGPCSTYMLMKMMSLSGSTFYKSRAGTAYSVTKRLVSAGYFAQVPQDSGDPHISVTPKGIEALREWLTPPIAPEEIAHSADLIRLRFYFISVIDADARLAFIDDSLEGLRQRLGFVEERMRLNAGDGHYFATLAGLSSLMETKARIEWLEHVRKWVVDPPKDKAGWVDEILNDSPF
jgi:DNA-binding PadR family transcriptional regulator